MNFSKDCDTPCGHVQDPVFIIQRFFIRKQHCRKIQLLIQTGQIRIPAFAKNLCVNGESTDTKDLAFEIGPGKTEIEVKFETAPYFKKRPHNLYALQMGSLLFSVPVSYEKQMREYTRRGVERKFPYCDYQLIPQTPWNYAFAADQFEISRNGPGDVPFSQEHPPITIKAKMQQVDWGLKFPYRSIARKTPKASVPITEVQEIELCPYGCARLRMTEMPALCKSSESQ